MRCVWCEEESAKETTSTVYWELPDGTKAIEITDTPTIECTECGMMYQDDQLIEELEDHLVLINIKNVPNCISYKALMAEPKLLKRNYFRF